MNIIPIVCILNRFPEKSSGLEVYMCLAVPVRVTETLGDDMARVRVGEGETFMEISTLLLEKMPEIGDYLIVHAGFGLRVLDPAEAEDSLKIFREMAALGPEIRV